MSERVLRLGRFSWFLFFMVVGLAGVAGCGLGSSKWHPPVSTLLLPSSCASVQFHAVGVEICYFVSFSLDLRRVPSVGGLVGSLPPTFSYERCCCDGPVLGLLCDVLSSSCQRSGAFLRPLVRSIFDSMRAIRFFPLGYIRPLTTV